MTETQGFDQHKNQVYSRAAIQAIESDTFAQGLPSLVLMNQAGFLSAEWISKSFPIRKNFTIWFICGKGGNSGDGFVAARYLTEWGYRCVVLHQTGEVETYHQDTKIFLKALQKTRCKILDSKDLGEARFKQEDLIVDAIFGNGTKGDVKEPYCTWIKTINDSKTTVISLDLPSGLECDRWSLPHISVKASFTLTFGMLKPCLIHYPSRSQVGELEVLDVGILNASYKKSPPTERILSKSEAASMIPKHAPDQHKYQKGHCLVIGGTEGTIGAPFLSALGASKSGVGLTSLFIPNKKNIPNYPPEIMLHSPNHSSEDFFSPQHTQEILNFIEKKKVSSLVIGMGIGLEPKTNEFCTQLATALKERFPDLPVVLDADGLSNWKHFEGKNTVFTPHVGEYKKYFDTNPIEIKCLDSIRKFTNELFGTLVYKSSITTIFANGAVPVTVHCGNQHLATAGSGDVLAGVIGGIAAQGCSIKQAAELGVFLCAKTSKINEHPVGLTASEIANTIPKVLSILSRECGINR